MEQDYDHSGARLTLLEHRRGQAACFPLPDVAMAANRFAKDARPAPPQIKGIAAVAASCDEAAMLVRLPRPASSARISLFPIKGGTVSTTPPPVGREAASNGWVNTF